MARYRVEMVLARTVTVEVDATDPRDAALAAQSKSRWLSVAGMRSRLKLLTVMNVTKDEGW